MALRKTLTVTVLAALTATSLGGCVGRFPATHKVLAWNESVTREKWVHEGIFVGLLIVPVYQVALLVDAVVLNSAEFWTGEKVLVKVDRPQRIEGQDGTYAIATYRANDSFDIEAFEADGTRHFTNVSRRGTDTLVFRDESGQEITELADIAHTRDILAQHRL